MNEYSTEQFIAFCKTKGDEKFNRRNIETCALTQFLASVEPNTASTLAFNTKGYVLARNLKHKTIARLKIHEHDVVAMFERDVFTFADVVRKLS
jgi:hypothetical protein